MRQGGHDSDQKLMSTGCPRKACSSIKPLPPPPKTGNTNSGAAAPAGTPPVNDVGEGSKVNQPKTPARTARTAKTLRVIVRRRFHGLRGSFAACSASSARNSCRSARATSCFCFSRLLFCAIEHTSMDTTRAQQKVPAAPHPGRDKSGRYAPFQLKLVSGCTPGLLYANVIRV